MFLKNFESEDVVLERANIHHGDLKKDKRFDCKDNCPYCNDEMICIKLQYILPVYELIEGAYIYKSFECHVCGEKFWEVWYADEDDYDIDSGGYYCEQCEAYTNEYYNQRHHEFCQSVEQAVETGCLEIVASYLYTVIEPPVEEKEYISELSQKHSYPTFRRLTPEIVDIFDMVEFGPIESRFEILDL